MPRNSCSRKHKLIQQMVEQVTEDLTPDTWNYQVFKEWNDGEFRIDVRILWSKPSGKLRGRYERYVEIQHDLTEQTYNNKKKKLIRRDIVVPSFGFVEIPEDVISNDWLEAYEQVKDYLEMFVPW